MTYCIVEKLQSRSWYFERAYGGWFTSGSSKYTSYLWNYYICNLEENPVLC